jgi:quercetin dioxygenase-like cupin family protein
LVNNHDPKHLQEEFEADHAGSYGWEYLEKGPTVWRIRISKLTTTPLPRIVTNTADIAGADVEPGVAGVTWKLEVRERDLDSNVIALAPNDGIDTHIGADVDVLIHVLSGSGRLITEQDTIELAPGAFVWLPRKSQRQFTAGPDGLRYLTVHQKREILPLTPTMRQVD